MADIKKTVYMFCGCAAFFSKQRILAAAVWFVLIFGFLMSDTALAAFPPDWLQAHLDGTLKMKNLYNGVSFAEYEGDLPGYDTMRLAKDRALDELSYQLSVSVRSTFEDSIVKKGDYEEQNIASSLFISTRKVLSGIGERDKWTDAGKRRYWVLLVIDKKEADRQMDQQKFINEVVDRLEHKQDEVIEGIKQMTMVLNNTMDIYNDRVDQLEGLLETIDDKIEASGTQTREGYGALRVEILRLQSSRKVYEDRLVASEQKHDQQMDALISQNEELKVLLGQLSQKIQGDYFLALADDDVRNKDLNRGLNVQIRPDKGQGADYYSGERVKFLLHASKGCFVKVTYISSAGGSAGAGKKMNTLLFPNEHDAYNWINAGETKVIGRFGELEIQDPFGMDVVTVVASETQFSDIEALLKGANGGYYSEMSSNTRGTLDIRKRGITVVRPAGGAVTGSGSPSPPAAVATDTCFIVSHSK